MQHMRIVFGQVKCAREHIYLLSYQIRHECAFCYEYFLRMDVFVIHTAHNAVVIYAHAISKQISYNDVRINHVCRSHNNK